MNLSLNELTKMATQEVNFDETFFTNIEECIKYNSIRNSQLGYPYLNHYSRKNCSVGSLILMKMKSLVRVLPTNVVYIRNIKLGSLTPFVTEHNSVYVYNEKTGKIEEVFE